MDRNIPGDIKRSMNAEMQRGELDGTLRFIRPDTSSNTDTTSALQRAATLEPKWHGYPGLPAPYVNQHGISVPTMADVDPDRPLR